MEGMSGREDAATSSRDMSGIDNLWLDDQGYAAIFARKLSQNLYPALNTQSLGQGEVAL